MKSKLGLGILAMLVTLVFAGTPAYAQATRTWVSGVGDDANPCSRTAPCKTFAGAISKTAPSGEINVLDPGGFGGVTITKPITISSEGFEAGVLVSGTNGIIVNVPNATDVVVLRGLDIQGLGTGLSGITVVTGGNVQVDKCTIDKFTVSGINFAPTVANSQLHVVDSIIRNNGKFTAPTSGQGVLVSGTTTRATFDNVRLEHNLAGLVTAGSSISSVSQSVSTGSLNAGFVTTGTSVLTLEKSVSTHNGTGVVCNAGTTVRMGNMSISNNGSVPTANVSTGGTCQTFKNNDIDGATVVGLTQVLQQ